MRILLAAAFALFAAGVAHAGELVLSLKAARPIEDAVVMVRPASGLPRTPIKFPWAYTVAQKDMTFTPFVLIVPVGADVSFPNLDPVRHHVYSFSPAKVFELKLYGREARYVRMDKPGVVALGCNIHDSMTGFIRVVDTPFAAKTGAAGEARITGLPPGPATVTIWHPYLKGAKNEIVQTVTIAAAGVTRLTVAAELRRPAMHHGGY